MITHQSPISGVAALGERYVATAGYDNQVILWDAATKRALQRTWHDHLANQAAFSPCGRWLVTSSSDHSARIWRLPDLKLQAVLGGHEDDVEMAVFHPRLPLVATASRDRRVRVFGVDGSLEHELAGHLSDVISVAWGASDEELLSTSDDGTVIRWDAARGRLVERIDLGGVETDTLVLGPGGVIYTGNDEGVITIIRGGTSTDVPAHAAGIKRLALSAERGLLASMSYDRSLKLWTVAPDGALALRAASSLPSILWPRSCAFRGERELVFGTFGTAYASYDYEADRWDVSGIAPTPGVNAVARLGGSVYTVGDAGLVRSDGAPHRELGSLCNFLTPWGDVLLTGGQLGTTFDALTGRALYTHRSPLNCAATFVEDGVESAVVGTYTGEALVFRKDASGRTRFERAVPLHDNAIKGIACSGGLIFSVCATGAAAWHSTRDFSEVRRLEKAHDKIANGCVALAGGFASISRDLKLRLWLGDAPARVLETPHVRSIKCVTASPDGTRLALGSYDGRVAVYDTRTGAWLAQTRPTTAGISSVCPDGDAFLASSYDSRVYRVEAA